MRLFLAFLISLSTVLGLTACGEKHATIQDCVTWLTVALEARGTDTTNIGSDIVDKCNENYKSMTQDKFDEIFLSK